MAHSNDKPDADLVEACVLLGLTPPFSADQAKIRFRELAKIYHPDAGVAKDSNRFAKISHAYDLIESNAQRLSTMRLSLASDAAAASSQVADLLQQLHEARAKAVFAEKKLSDRADELAAMRQFINGTRSGSMKRTIAIGLLCTAALFLGFLAGMVWSAQDPIIPLKPPGEYLLSAANEVTTETMFQVDDRFHARAAVTIRTNGVYGVSLTSGTVKLGKNTATLFTSPTLRIAHPPDVSVQVQNLYYPATTATGTR